MIPSNNLSVLPWYTSLDQQNAKKWWNYGKVYPLYMQATFFLPFQILREHSTRDIDLFEIYKEDGTYYGEYTTEMTDNGLQVVQFASYGYDVIVYSSLLSVFTSMDNGRYYAVLSDVTNTWYSEVFTVVNDISPYMKLMWWDTSDLVMDAGRILYTSPSYKNVLYLPSDLAKPEYEFEEEAEERDGYTFPTKQVSKKVFHFSFLAPEYLLDVMRLIRMADYQEITYNGQRYSIDSFLMTPEWEDNGDIATVDAEFSTATVAKKIGLAYVKAQRGDFNDDFNDDFDNE